MSTTKEIPTTEVILNDPVNDTDTVIEDLSITVPEQCNYLDEANRVDDYVCPHVPKCQIHEALTCRHYSQIRRLLTNNTVITDNERRLFNLAEPFMKIADIRAVKVRENPILVTANELLQFSKLTDREKTEYREYFRIDENVELATTTVKTEPDFTFGGKLEVFTNIEVDSKGLAQLFGTFNPAREITAARFVRVLNPYQATIHELWHCIDHLAGNVENGVAIPYTRSFITQLETEIDKDVKKHQFFFNIDTGPIGRLRKNNPPDNELFYLFDIVEGISHSLNRRDNNNRFFTSIYAPRSQEYWKSDGGDQTGRRNLAAEFFAAVGCIATVGDSNALERIRHYLRNAYTVYEDIVKTAIPRIRNLYSNATVEER